MNPENTPPPFVGAWRLVSFELRREDDEIILPFGEAPRGSLLYTPGGRFSYQGHRPDRPHVAAGDQMKSSEEETMLNYRGYVAYYGLWRWEAAEGAVVHRVEGSLFPNWEGREQRRYVRLAGGRLELATPPTQWGGGEIIQACTVWERTTG